MRGQKVDRSDAGPMGRSSLTSSTSSEDFSSLEWKRSNSQVLISRLLPANILNHIPKSCRREGLFSFSWIFSSGGGAPLPAEILAGQHRGRAPMSYDSFYPTFRPPAQARKGVGRGLRRGPSAAMSRL